MLRCPKTPKLSYTSSWNMNYRLKIHALNTNSKESTVLGIFDLLPSPWKSLINSNGTPIVSHSTPVMQNTLFLNGKSFSLNSINSKKRCWELVEMIRNHDLDWETILFHMSQSDTIHYRISIQNENCQLSTLHFL